MSQITTLTNHRSPQNQPHYFIRTHHLNRRPLCWSHQNKGSINQDCHKRFYRHMFFWFIYFFTFETSATAFVSVGASWKTRWYSMYNTYLYVFFSILWLVYLTSCLFSSWTKSPCTKRRALPTAHCILYTYNSTLAVSARADPRSNPEKVTSDIDPFGACPMPSSGCTWTLSLHNKQRMKSHRAQPWLHA